MSENRFATEDLFDVTAGLEKESDAVSEQMHEAFDRTGTKSTFSDFLAPQAATEEKTADTIHVAEEHLTATEKKILGI